MRRSTPPRILVWIARHEWGKQVRLPRRETAGGSLGNSDVAPDFVCADIVERHADPSVALGSVVPPASSSSFRRRTARSRNRSRLLHCTRPGADQVGHLHVAVQQAQLSQRMQPEPSHDQQPRGAHSRRSLNDLQGQTCAGARWAGFQMAPVPPVDGAAGTVRVVPARRQSCVRGSPGRYRPGAHTASKVAMRCMLIGYRAK
jgi:hypothetical protein